MLVNKLEQLTRLFKEPASTWSLGRGAQVELGATSSRITRASCDRVTTPAVGDPSESGEPFTNKVSGAWSGA